MGILSTLGSLALTGFTTAKAIKNISKAVTTPKKSNSGGSFVTKTKPTSTQNDEYSKLMKSITPTLESLDDNTPMTIGGDYVEGRTGVTTGIGFGEGQTVDSIMKGYNVPAYRTQEKENPLYRKAIEEVRSIESGVDVNVARELDSSWTDFFTGASRIFSNTKNIDGKSISEIKIARDKAVRDVADFKNPNSAIHQSFKKNIESQGYDYDKDFKNEVEGTKSYLEGIKYDKSNAYESSGIRGYYDLPIISSVVNKATGGEYGRFTRAIGQAKSEGIEGVESNGAYMTSNILGGALLYGTIGGGVQRAATSGLSEVGFGLGGRVGGNLVVAANRIKAIEQASPTLYAIAVDNPLTTVVDYGVTKSLGGKYSGEDVAQSLITGTALPLILKGATSSLGGIWKGMTTKTLSEIDSQVSKLTKDGAMTHNDALIKVAGEYEIEPGKTIMDAMDEANVTPRSTISPEESRSALSQRGVSVSSTASKKISSVLNNLNKKIDNLIGKEDVGGGYGEISESGKAIQAKAAIVAKLDEAKIVDGKTADTIIKEGLESNGLKYTASKGDVPIREGEVLDDALHNPRFSGSKLKEAEDMDTIGEAITGAERTTPTKDDIASARSHVSTSSKDAETQVRNIATKSGIDIDERKLVTKVDDGEGGTTFVLNKKYAEDILYRAEVKTTGYTQAKSTALSRTKRLISEGATTIRSGMNNFSRTLKLGATEWKRMVTKSGDELYNSSSYSHLPTATRRRIIDASLKSNDGSLASLEKRIAIADEKLHMATFNKLESDVNAIIKDIKKKSKSRTEKNTIDIGKEEEMILAYNDFNEAKLNGDLVGMKAVYDNLKLFEKEGRSIYKEDLAIRKESTRRNSVNIVRELEMSGESEYRMRMVNSPSSGTIGVTANPKGLDNAARVVEDLLPAHLQFARIGGKDSELTRIFHKDLHAGESSTQATYHNLLNNYHDVTVSLKKMKSPEDSKIAKYSIWRIMNSTFDVPKQGRISGKEYLMKADIFGYYDKNGKPQIFTVSNGDKFRATNADKIRKGEIIDGWSNLEENKSKFFDDIKKEFDYEYANNQGFKKGEDYFRAHFKAQGEKNASIFRRVYNKVMPLVDLYHPLNIHGKIQKSIQAVGENGELDTDVFRQSIDATHTLGRVGPGDRIRINLDMINSITNHTNGAVHWGNIIEPLNNAEQTFRLLERGRSIINNSGDEVDDIIAQEMGLVGKDGKEGDPYKLILDEGSKLGNSVPIAGDRIFSQESSRFIREHLNKVATRGGSISSSGVQVIQAKGLGYLTGRMYQTMLTGVTTTLKQTYSTTVSVTLGGVKNFTTATKSAFNSDNWNLLLDESGFLKDRQANIISGTSVKHYTIDESSSLASRIKTEYITGGGAIGTTGRILGTTYNKAVEKIDLIPEFLLGNMLKGVDGGVSYTSMITGISKYLDENYPNLHTAGSKLDLPSIKRKLTSYHYDADGVLIKVDDREWRKVITEGEIFMHKVMSSNSMVDDALGSKGTLGRIMQFMGKSATNHVISHYDAIIHNSIERKFAGVKLDGDRADKIRKFSYWVAGATLTTAISEYLKLKNNQFNEWSGRIEEGSKPTTISELINNKKDAYEFTDFLITFAQGQFFTPQSQVNFLEGFKGISDSYKVYNKQESSEGKTKALIGMGIGALPIHYQWTDTIKKFAGDVSGEDFSLSGLNQEAKAGASVKKAYGDKFNELTQSQKDELIAQQKRLSQYSKDNAKPDIKAQFIQSISKRKLSESEFMAELNKNPEVRASLKNDKELRALYNSHTTSTAKTSGERDSLLMGKPLKTVYDLEIVPMAESGDFKGAFERIKEMRRKGIIKSDKGALQMMDSLKELHSRKSK